MMTVPTIGHDIDAGSCAVAVGNTELRVPHVASGLVLCLFDGVDVAGVAHVLATDGPAPGSPSSPWSPWSPSSPSSPAPWSRSEPPAWRSGFLIVAAVPELLALLRGAGARPALQAVLVGASTGCLGGRLSSAATRTLHQARAALAAVDVDIVGEFCGGAEVRAVRFDGHGELRVVGSGQTSSVSLRRRLRLLRA